VDARQGRVVAALHDDHRRRLLEGQVPRRVGGEVRRLVDRAGGAWRAARRLARRHAARETPVAVGGERDDPDTRPAGESLSG